jgi:diguanylate cyclase (GGDEF)-like protein/PAS domain S-box-containing protein
LRQFSFSTVILTVVFTALVCVSGSLLYLAHQSSQAALKEEIKLSYSQDTQLLRRMVSDYFSTIGQLTTEISTRQDIRSGVISGDTHTISMVLSENLLSSSNQQVDAVVITSTNINPIQINGSVLYGIDVPLADHINTDWNNNSWETFSVSDAENTYEFAHYQTPIISSQLGEVIGTIHSYILLNENYSLLTESLEITGATGVAIKSKGLTLGVVLPEGITESDFTTTDPEHPIQNLKSGSKQLHEISIGNKAYFFQLFKSGNSNKLLAEAYNKTLWSGTVLIIIIALLAMLLIRFMTNRSLNSLTNYAEQASHGASPSSYSEESFLEFNKVGHQIETMVRDIREQENQLESILRHTPSAVFMKSLDLSYLMVNNQFAELFSSEDAASIIGQNDYSIFSQKEADKVRDTDIQVLDQKQTVQSELVLSSNAGLKTFLSTKFPLLDEKGELYGIGGITTDITEKLKAEKEAKITQLVFDAAAEAILIIKPEGEVITNSSFTRITGFNDEQAKPFASLLFSEHPEIERSISTSGQWQGESLRRKENGEILPIWISISTIQDTSDEQSYVVVFSDISQLKEAERKLEKFAHYDNLTNLPNRSLFYDRIESALSRSARSGKKTALLYIDIDHFKQINDSIGHQAGDLLLIETAKRISNQIRPGDTVSRLGSDEFTVILSELDDADGVQDIARNIQLEMQQPILLGGKDINTSASIGIAIFPDDGLEAEQLIKHADTAMFHVKQSGRNDIMFFDKNLNAYAEARIQLENHLKKALYSDELFLVYQPRYSIDGKQVISAEALLRWNHQSKGSIPPSEFIPLAESSGLIVEIGQMVLLKACDAAANWNQKCKKEVSVSVNLSARQLHDSNILSDIENALNASGLDPSLLELEITETMVIQDMDMVIARLEAIRKIGVRLSVDDFGTGYSSLIYLKRLPVSTVKIDKSFIDDVPGTSDGENLIKAVISMSHSLNLNVVAEGVETEEQLSFLTEHHCDEIQGFLLGKPDSAQALEKRLAT